MNLSSIDDDDHRLQQLKEEEEDRDKDEGEFFMVEGRNGTNKWSKLALITRKRQE